MKHLPPELMAMLEETEGDQESALAARECIRLALSESPELADTTGQPRFLKYRSYCLEHILIETTPGISHVLPYSAEGMARLCRLFREEFAGPCVGSC